MRYLAIDLILEANGFALPDTNLPPPAGQSTGAVFKEHCDVSACLDDLGAAMEAGPVAAPEFKCGSCWDACQNPANTRECRL